MSKGSKILKSVIFIGVFIFAIKSVSDDLRIMETVSGHPLSADVRNLELEYARAVKKMLDGKYYNGYNKYYNNMGRRYL